jgi:HK97 family phage portal protein
MRDVLRIESRSATPTSWDLLRTGGGLDTDAGVPVSPHLAENMSAVFACVQIISESVASLPLAVYRTDAGAQVRSAAPGHPVSQLFAGDPNDLQTAPEFIEMMTAHCLLRGNSYAEIVRDAKGQPVQLIPLHPDWVSVVTFANSRRIAYDVSDPRGGTRRVLPEEMLHLKDRSDDGIIGKSRLHRARETFGTVAATERFAAANFRNGAALSGVLSHPEQIGEEAGQNLRRSFESIYKGADNAGRIAILEEGLKWQAISVSAEDAQMLESRRFGVEAIARIFRVPLPVLGDLTNANYSNVVEMNRMFFGHCLQPWLVRWEKLIQRSLFSEAGRASYEVEFDADLLLRGDMLTRFQAYRIARETGVYNANELRAFEKQNPRTDPGGDEYLTPANMASEQTGRPKADVTGGG